MEHLSDAPFFGKLLVFPANVRLGCKVIASTNNTLAYLASSTVTKEKCFTTLTTGAKAKKTFLDASSVPARAGYSVYSWLDFQPNQ